MGYRVEQNGLLRGFVRFFCFVRSWQRRLGWLYHGRTQGVLGVRPESFLQLRPLHGFTTTQNCFDFVF